VTTAGHGTPSTRTAWGSHLYNPLLLGIANIGARALPYQQKLNIIKYKTAVMGFLVRLALKSRRNLMIAVQKISIYMGKVFSPVVRTD
jgi:hypothetical protein